MLSYEAFVDYVIDFYGVGGLYDIGVTHEHVWFALGVRLCSRKDIEFHGDTFDRELVRDILIDELGYKWEVAA